MSKVENNKFNFITVFIGLSEDFYKQRFKALFHVNKNQLMK